MFDEGVFAIPGADGQPIRCEVLFTYDCEANGRSYVVYTFGEEEQKQIGANRYETNDAGETRLLPIENERERDLLAHCFEELKEKLRAQQAAEAEG